MKRPGLPGLAAAPFTVIERTALGLTIGPILIALSVIGCGASRPAINQETTAGIPPSLLAGARPIGRGQRFTPPVTGHPTGTCTPTLKHAEEAHIELFAQNKVVLIAAGVGTQPPRIERDGQILKAHCYGNVVTLAPTGVVYFRRNATLQDLFAAWGQPFTQTRLASFSGHPRAYIDGRRTTTVPTTLENRQEIVLEVGPYVPPHRSFTFSEAG